jgi:3-carboxy-cis,cis-muconate cycloisomerase
MLVGLYGDERINELFSSESTIDTWLRTEAALATAQGELGVLTAQDAAAVVEAATLENIDQDRLWKETRNVGYPILSVVRQIDAALPEARRGHVHYGATTQDIMDTGLALQLNEASARLAELLNRFGDALAALAQRHVDTVLAGRTHALQAVPTTFGAKLASYLGELTRHRERLASARDRVAMVSLFGAAGTSAAYGAQAPALRRRVAELLGLGSSAVPWHVARDSPAEFGLVCALLAGTCARFAREVVDLSRTEIGEVAEADGHHRGASSTMPQKVNPIESEAVIGMSVSAGALSSALLRAMEAGHERAAGEWQAEWQVLPQLVCLAGGALGTAGSTAEGLQVFPDVMRANLQADGGMVMAEAYMMLLAPKLGREHAHDLVYQAVRDSRSTGEPLISVLKRSLPSDVAGLAGLAGATGVQGTELTPESYLGQTRETVAAALAMWSRLPH